MNKTRMFLTVGVKVLSDCGVHTAEVDAFSDPKGTLSLEGVCEVTFDVM